VTTNSASSPRNRQAGPGVVIGVERRLIQQQVCDGQAADGGLERERGAGGVAEHRRGPASLLDQRGVVDLTLDRVRRGLPAVATYRSNAITVPSADATV
jgi:hypothetical protein